MPSPDPVYKEYPCLYQAPLMCDRPQQTIEQVPGAKWCMECGFPAILPPKAEIRGSRGTYQLNSFLGSRGMGRLYSGIQMSDSQPVVIKEYLLPTRCFNSEETRQRQDAFIRVAGLIPDNNKVKNFRIINPWEAIADQSGERCYLVTKGNLGSAQTLRSYLQQKEAMTAPQVRELLNQTLQTLEFLHSLTSGQVQKGLAHGNLSLDSLLIAENQQQFYIYFSDLAAWERLFEPPILQPANPKPEQDLVALAEVAVYLWMGRAEGFIANQPLDPRDIQQWPNSDEHLKKFLYRLLGLNTPFTSAADARQSLLQLPKPSPGNTLAGSNDPEHTERGLPIPWILLAILALFLLSGGIWYLLKPNPKPPDDNFVPFNQLLPSFSDVPSLPLGDFTYTGESNGTWSDIWGKKHGSYLTLKELLTKPKQDLATTFSYKPSSLPSIPIEKVKECQTEWKKEKKCQASFAITSLSDISTDNLITEKVAYDGLIVFVAANSNKLGNLPEALKGQIRIEQLRQLYTGKITNWNQIDGPSIPVKLYVPTDPEALQQFEQRVLKNDNNIEVFRNLTVNHHLSTKETAQQIRYAFDNERVGIISFGIISETWDQCELYPLSLIDDNNNSSQAIVRLNGDPIDPKKYNLCDKTNRLNVQTFVKEKYSLGYPLYVVYPKDNSLPPAGGKFAELLRTREGQCLLGNLGLVPLQPIPDNYPCLPRR